MSRASASIRLFANNNDENVGHNTFEVRSSNTRSLQDATNTLNRQGCVETQAYSPQKGHRMPGDTVLTTRGHFDSELTRRVEEKLSNVLEKLKTLQDTVTALQDDNTEKDSKIKTLEDTVTALQDDNTEKDSKIKTLEDTVMTQDSRIRTLEDTVTALQDDNTEKEGTVTALQDDNTEKDSRIAALEDTVSALEDTAMTHEHQIFELHCQFYESSQYGYHINTQLTSLMVEAVDREMAARVIKKLWDLLEPQMTDSLKSLCPDMYEAVFKIRRRKLKGDDWKEMKRLCSNVFGCDPGDLCRLMRGFKLMKDPFNALVHRYQPLSRYVQEAHSVLNATVRRAHVNQSLEGMTLQFVQDVINAGPELHPYEHQLPPWVNTIGLPLANSQAQSIMAHYCTDEFGRCGVCWQCNYRNTPVPDRFNWHRP